MLWSAPGRSAMTLTCDGPPARSSMCMAGAHKARRGPPEGSRQPLWTLRRQRRAALVLPCSSTQEAAGSVHKGGCGRGREGQGGPARLRARARVRHLVLPRRAGHVDGPPADPGAAQRLERALRLAGMPAPQQPPHGRPPGVTPNRNASVQTTALTLRHSRPAPAPCITAAPSNTGGRYA